MNIQVKTDIKLDECDEDVRTDCKNDHLTSKVLGHVTRHSVSLILTSVLFSVLLPSFPSIPSLYFLPSFLSLSSSSLIVTRLGGFFIKRRLDSSSGKDVLYRKCLHEVIQLIKWVWLAGHVTKGPGCTISAIWCAYIITCVM